jgi:hypothetical protein
MEINEKMNEQIVNAAKHLDMDVEEAIAKFTSIMEKNDVDPAENEGLALSMWRQYYVNARQMQNRPAPTTGNSGGGGGFYKTASGFFATSDMPFDMMAIQRRKAVAEYERDGTHAYNEGIVAIALAQEDGTYAVKQTYRGEEVEKSVPNLPANHVEVSQGTFIIPLDTTDFEWNKGKYGKPLPKEEWRMQGVFFGDVDGVTGKWFFHYRGAAAKDFTPEAFKWLHFTCVLNSNDATKIHGARATTLKSLAYDVDLEDDDDRKRNPEVSDMQDMLMEYSAENYCPLVDLEAYHTTVEEKAYADRFVFTDGSVNHINMNVSEKTGNRIINIDDLTLFATGEIDFDTDAGAVTCWTPERVNINFGIGSNVIITGRTTQGTDSETNELRPVSINVLGLLVTEQQGTIPDPITNDGEDDDWILPDVDFTEGNSED